jgi:hypothetical protein
LSSIPDKYKELLQAVAVDLKTVLWSERIEDVKIVQKGLLLYRQGLVSKARLEDEMVLAMVQDVTRVNVELNLNFLQLSNCSCPTEGMCRHQLAVFFYTYSQIGSVSEWVSEWRQPIREKKVAQKLGLQRAKDLLKSTGTLKPDYDRWVESFNISFHSIIGEKKRQKPYLIPELFQVYMRKLKAGAPFEHEWKQLYFLVAYIHTFRNLLHLKYNQEEMDRYYEDILYQLTEEIEAILDRLSIHALPFAFDEFIEKLKDDSFYLIAEDIGLDYDRSELYIILWTNFFKKRKWHEEELKKIQQQKEKTFLLAIGSIHQKLMLGLDDEALRLLHSIQEIAAPYMLLWLDAFTVGKEWKRMGPFIEFFISILPKYIHGIPDGYARMEFTRYAIKAISPYVRETNKVDVYEKVLIQLLPYSYRMYDDFLFSQQSYEKWGDLQTYVGFDIGSISSEKIKLLQKEEPKVLLPLYHQSIQQHIDMKNRGNYRVAVRQLKKLRTLYKKLKRQEDWKQYLEILLERTKRLRAFQEECERGKLIHA